MMVSDEVVAVFPSKFKDGDVRLVYYVIIGRVSNKGRRVECLRLMLM